MKSCFMFASVVLAVQVASTQSVSSQTSVIDNCMGCDTKWTSVHLLMSIADGFVLGKLTTANAVVAVGAENAWMVEYIIKKRQEEGWRAQFHSDCFEALPLASPQYDLRARQLQEVGYGSRAFDGAKLADQEFDWEGFLLLATVQALGCVAQ